MRVLTLTPFFPSAADDARGCFVAEPLTALEAIGIKSTVIAVEPIYRSPSTSNGHPASWVRYIAIPGRAGLASAGFFLYETLRARVRKLHSNDPFDLIHAHAPLPCGYAAMLIARDLQIPYVITVHGRDVFFRKQVPGISGLWCERVTQSVYKSAARVVCISRTVASEIRCHNGNVDVIYNGVNAANFFPSTTNADRTILSVGNLISTKGHALLLRAVGILGSRYSDLRCDIIGDGPERERLCRLAAELGIAHRVQFKGKQNRNQVAAAMAQCTMFALPSSYEGFGCVYLEAMASGKPVIGCRQQGIEEVISHEQNGFLIDPEDLQGLSLTLSRLLDNAELRERIGREASKTILEGYTLRHQAEHLAQTYRDCVA